eukprot:scaffold2329_cov247-Pinguiococcus_pyrenoidosus.AAC.19
MAEDEKVLGLLARLAVLAGLPGALGEAERLRHLLQAPEGFSTAASDVPNAFRGHLDHLHVVATLRLRHAHAVALLQEHLQVLAAARALGFEAHHARELAHRVGVVVALQHVHIKAPAVKIHVALDEGRELELVAIDAEARLLVLDGAEHLEERAAAASERAEDAHLLAAVAFLAVAAGVGEEHERAPLLLHAAQRLAPLAHDEAHAGAGDGERGRVVARRRVRMRQVQVDIPHALLTNVVHIVLGARHIPRRAADRELVGVRVDAHVHSGRARHLALGGALAAHEEGGVLRADLHHLRGILLPVLVIVVVAVVVRAAPPVVGVFVVVARHPGCSDRPHRAR